MTTMHKYAVAASAVMCVAMLASSQMKYVPLSDYPLLGTLAQDNERRYTRLPDSLQGVVREELWSLGQNSAGLAVRFATDASDINVQWTSLNSFAMNHMTATGIRGLDLYVLDSLGAWQWVNSARPNLNKAKTTARVVRGLEPKVMREYMLYLPLYDGVDSLSIGVDSLATVAMPDVAYADTPCRLKPLVMYGTSILQGGCATRAGMAHTNIIMRRLNREVINLGFSGNARLDPEIARLMSAADAGAYIVDALPNCTSQMVDSLMEPFVAILRTAHPNVPIMLVESPLFPIMRYEDDVRQAIEAKNASLRSIYERLVARGDKLLYYFEARDVLGDDTECSVDNYHLTDGGFEAFATRLIKAIQTMLPPE